MRHDHTLGDAVGVGLVLSTVMRIFFTIVQQDLVQLLVVVLVERNVLNSSPHQFSVTGYLLFVAGVEGLDGQIGEQARHLAVSQLPI